MTMYWLPYINFEEGLTISIVTWSSCLEAEKLRSQWTLVAVLVFVSSAVSYSDYNVVDVSRQEEPVKVAT